jgi:hypothetical protein
MNNIAHRRQDTFILNYTRKDRYQFPQIGRMDGWEPLRLKNMNIIR